MKNFTFNNEKNLKLKKERNISFEKIINYIKNGYLLDVIENKNYKNQKIFIIKIKNYVFLVPFVENENEIFLKTIFPSRKFTKIYLGDKNENL